MSALRSVQNTFGVPDASISHASAGVSARARPETPNRPSRATIAAEEIRRREVTRGIVARERPGSGHRKDAPRSGGAEAQRSKDRSQVRTFRGSRNTDGGGMERLGRSQQLRQAPSLAPPLPVPSAPLPFLELPNFRTSEPSNGCITPAPLLLCCSSARCRAGPERCPGRGRTPSCRRGSHCSRPFRRPPTRRPGRSTPRFP